MSVERQPGLHNQPLQLVFEGNQVVMRILALYIILIGFLVIRREGKGSVFLFPALEQRK